MGLQHAKRSLECTLLGLPWRDTRPGEVPGVVGVGIGTKVVDGRDTGARCLKVYVAQKLDPADLEPRNCVPDRLGGCLTDVEAAGEVRAHAFSQRVRPIPGGSSIDHLGGGTGTLGCVVEDARTRERLLLSNNHVLAAENRGEAGDPILQPGPGDGGRVEYDAVARLAAFHPLHETGVNNIDAALAKPDDDALFEGELRGLGPVRGTARPRVGMRVRKSGRTTELTEGRVIDVDATIRIIYTGGLLLFKDQMIIRGEGRPFSSFGDSGSLVVDRRNRAVGLLSGGSPFVTVANKILWVLRGMKVRFPRGAAA